MAKMEGEVKMSLKKALTHIQEARKEIYKAVGTTIHCDKKIRLLKRVDFLLREEADLWADYQYKKEIQDLQEKLDSKPKDD